jgi:hypothetical protein
VYVEDGEGGCGELLVQVIEDMEENVLNLKKRPLPEEVVKAFD